jgi:sirohydrochlorin ferrochelatase
VRPARLSTTDGSPLAGQAPYGTPPLILVAHGSRDPRAAATAEDLADLVRQRGPRRGLHGLDVSVAYLGHAAPSPGQVLGALPGGPVVVLPLLLTAAYHSKTDIPAALDAAAARRRSIGRTDTLRRSIGRTDTLRRGGDPLEIRYGDPLGPHPLLVTALERRLTEAGVPAGDPGTSVVLAAAGSTDPAARAAITALASRWQRQRGWREVVPAYASAAAPTPGAAVSALREAGAGRVVVATYLLAPGRFAAQVAREARSAGAQAVSGVLGAAPELADVLLARYAAARASLRPIQRRIA